MVSSPSAIRPLGGGGPHLGQSQLALLREHGIRPIKRRGQNFLIDGNLARWLAGQVLELGRTVLELGAGAGALTGPLLAAGATVTAVEIDRKLCEVLRGEFGGATRFRLLQADLAQLDWPQVLAACGERPVVAGNLPYVLTSTVLFQLAQQRERFAGAVLMVQKEVAQRLTSGTGRAEYGVLAAVLGSLFRIEALRSVPANVFWPRPEVSSCVVKLAPAGSWPEAEYRAFLETVKALFGQRRKQVGTILRSLFELSRAEVDRVCAQAGIDQDSRPERLTQAQLRLLARILEAKKDA
jgi:16S rRNA (adenine1518-N6/adenine1519-N6)-dimethyltransferase